MQEKQRIERQLLELQGQCVKQYLESKLETITTKEVVSDILQGFLTVNNVEFMQNISENIYEAKVTNRLLKQQIETLRSDHLVELEQLRDKITQERDLANEKKYNQVILQLKQRTHEQGFLIKEGQRRVQQLNSQNSSLKAKLEDLISKHATVEGLLAKTRQQGQTNSQDHAIVQQQLKGRIAQVQREYESRIVGLKSQRDTLQDQLALLEKTSTQIKNKLQSDLEYKNSQLAALQSQLKEVTDSNLQHEAALAACTLKLSLLQKDHQSIQCQKELLLQEKQSLELSQKYLQEENQYLRQEIITFKDRETKFTDEKQKLTKQLENLMQSTSLQIQQLHMAKLNLQQELKQSLSTLSDDYEAQAFAFRVDAERLNESIKTLEAAIATKDELIRQTQLQLQNQRQQNKCLHTQINLHFQQNQVHERQIQHYENELLKVNQECRAQLETFKETYQLNWNGLNEQLIEERYQAKQLREHIESLNEELSVQKDRQRFYSMYVEQISHLKRQLQIVSSNKNYLFDRSEVQFADNKSKFYFYLNKIKQELKGLKRQNLQLKEKIMSQASAYQASFEDSISHLVVKLQEQYLKCSYCEHQKTMNSKGHFSQPTSIAFEKTMPKVTQRQAPSLSNLKKSLKSIQQRYNAVNEENKYYTQHIRSIIKSP